MISDLPLSDSMRAFSDSYALNPISVLDIESAKINTEDFKLVCGPSDIYWSCLFSGCGANSQALSFLCIKARARASLEDVDKVKALRYRVFIGENQSSVVGILQDLTLFIICSRDLDSLHSLITANCLT